MEIFETTIPPRGPGCLKKAGSRDRQGARERKEEERRGD